MNAYWEGNPAAVSINALCQRLGLAKPSLYREFGNEDGLTRAILEHYAETVMTQVLLRISGDIGFDAKLDTLIAYVSEDDLSKTGCVFFKMRALRSRFGENTQNLISHIEANGLAGYEELLEKARKTGEWSGDTPTPLAAHYLFSQIGLALSLRGAGEDPATVRGLVTLALGIFRTCTTN